MPDDEQRGEQWREAYRKWQHVPGPVKPSAIFEYAWTAATEASQEEVERLKRIVKAYDDKCPPYATRLRELEDRAERAESERDEQAELIEHQYDHIVRLQSANAALRERLETIGQCSWGCSTCREQARAALAPQEES